MFPYFGSKSILAPLYPKPFYNLIIEPFAGSARYSLLYSKHKVLLCDNSPYVFGLWKWLIEEATEEDIASLPYVQPGDTIPVMSPVPRRWLLSFLSNKGTYTPRNVAGRLNNKRTPTVDGIVPNLHKTRHWNVVLSHYSHLSNVIATWFIDPPYINHWKSDINYDHLAKWCRSRRGQVIVCERLGADWLPFRYLASLANQTRRLGDEVFWTNTDL